MAKPFVYFELQKPHTLVLQPDPRGIGKHSTPGADQILCQTDVSALSPGTELSAYRGDPPLRPQTQVYPRLMGYCNVATILARGPDVPAHLQVGDRVLTHQSHRSGFMVQHGAVLAKLPVGMPADKASVTYLFHLGYAAFLKSGAVQGDTAAILGLGTLGLTTAALFANAGIGMTGFTNYAPDAVVTQAFGLREVAPKEAGTYANSFDHVVVSTNAWDDWNLALDLCRADATITVLSFPGRGQGVPKFNPLDSRYFYDKQLRIQSCGYMPQSVGNSRRDQPRTVSRNCAFLLDAINRGQLPASALIDSSVPFERLDAVYAGMLAGNRSAQTFVLDWSSAAYRYV